MRDVILIVVLIFLFAGEPDVFDSLRSRAMAAVDNGCNSHKQLHIEQEHTLRIDNYNLNSLRGE